jgi:hypothetical protein
VPKLSEGRGGERNLGKWRQPLANEPLEPAECRSFVACRMDVRQSSHSNSASASHSPPISRVAISAGLNVTAMDGALEAAVC